VYSPNGNQIASGSSDGSVRLWDAIAGEPLIVIDYFKKQILSIDWKIIGNEQYLVSGGVEGEVRCWGVAEDGNKLKAYLRWSSTHNELLVKDAVLKGIQDLSQENTLLVSQRGAITC
jgi:WD40 repeat protein